MERKTINYICSDFSVRYLKYVPLNNPMLPASTCLASFC